MSCERYRDALTDVAAGGPAPVEVEAHLASCEGCREELAALRRALAVAEAEMARLVGAEPSPGLTARVRSSIAQSGSARTWRIGWLWPATAVAAAVVVTIAVLVARAPAPARVAVETRPTVAPGKGGLAAEGARLSEAPERTVSPPPAPAAAEVLVPRGGIEALVQFAAIVHRGRQTPGAFAMVGQPPADLVEPAEIAITPLEIVPLEPAETPGT